MAGDMKGYTAEEIAKSLRVCGSAERGCSECIALGEGRYRPCIQVLLEGAADALEAQAELIRKLVKQERQRWIPVEERLPETDDGPILITEDYTAVLVLVMIEGAKTATTLYCDVDNHDFFDMQGDELIPYRVTHWMPLPEGPEVGHE